MQHIIAVVGLVGSGKTEATMRFLLKNFERVGFNDPVYEELEKQGLARNEVNERMVREYLRKKFGMGAMAKLSLSKVEHAIAGGKNVVIESLYSWSEYKIMKDRFGDQFHVCAVYAPASLRYNRLAIREVRPLGFQEAYSRDHAEIENIEKAGPIAIADYTIHNAGVSKEKFLSEVDAYIAEILKQ